MTLQTGSDHELGPENARAALSMVRRGIETLLEKRLNGPFGARDQAEYDHLTKMEDVLLTMLPPHPRG
jgi:hypothetical protein